MTIGNVHFGLKGYAKTKPTDVAVVYKNRSLTFKQLYLRVNSLANSLLDLGVKKGDHIALYMKNNMEMLEILYAISTVGAVVVPINYMVEGSDLVHLIKKSEVKYIFVEQKQLTKFEEVKHELNNNLKTILIGCDTKASYTLYEDLLENGSKSDPDIEVNSNDLFAILFSSGTTSSPKGSEITHEKQIIRELYTSINWETTRDDVLLITVPIYHSVGFNMIFRPCLIGCKVVITREFEPEETLKIIEREQVTQSFFVPTQYKSLLDVSSFKEYDKNSLNLLVTAGAPISKEVKETIVKKFKSNLLEFFGSTETSSYINLYPEDVIRKSASVGQQVSHMEVRLVDKQGKEVEIGGEGEFAVRGPALFNGYYKEPEKTSEAFLPGEWFLTGDMGKMDDEGFYYLLDRKKDMIISGGVNVYPQDIEQVIYTHPSVSETAVVGIPHEKWGESVKAYVVLKDGESVNKEELINYCNNKMAGFQQIKELEFLPSLPRNPSGKILKRELRKG